LPSGTPPAVRNLLRRCLDKDPRQRLQHMGEARIAIERGGDGPAEPVAAPRKNRERMLLPAAAIAVVAALALGAFAYFHRAPEEAQAVRFLISPPDTWSLPPRGSTGAVTLPLSVSPDGRRIAFVARSAEGKYLLWVRPLDTLTAQALVGTDGALSPFWSPDSRFLGFFAGGKLKKIEVSGGPPITLCDVSGPPGGGAWNRDGVIVFAPTNRSALLKVSASGGVPSAATALGQGETAHVRPSLLPDGQHFLYRAITGSTVQPIYLASLDSTERKSLLNSDSNNVVYTQGHLLFLRETTLMAQPFDARRLELTGEAFPIAEQIQTQATPPYGLFSASENGVLAYQTGPGAAGSQLVWFDRTGKQIGVLGDSAAYTDIELSPDGKRASVSIPDQAGKGRDIWLYDVARGLRTRFTFDPADELNSIWSPDGSRLVFNSRRKGHLDLYQKASSGAGTDELLLEDNLEKYPWSWSPDGRFVLYVSDSGPTGADLWVLPLSGDRKPFPFLKTPFNENPGQFSSDGRWVAYVSDESGRSEVYVAPFPGPGGKWQISTGGGSWPRWRHDRTEIFYLAPDNNLMAAAVIGNRASFEVGAVKPLFQTRETGSRHRYDVSADGQRFLINTAPEQAASAPITVVVNWTAGLKK
jgi:eukaryotic-like serine/threonine-protein kinase